MLRSDCCNAQPPDVFQHLERLGELIRRVVVLAQGNVVANCFRVVPPYNDKRTWVTGFDKNALTLGDSHCAMYPLSKVRHSSITTQGFCKSKDVLLKGV